ncbi:FecR domain-containing protein [Delftia tsuruhatensis]|uniref:FecR domain-containing protein n=1 Tax=Delftia tsuruhatensis TaxID=180282 RepID=UPI002260D26C|nr:FecR domain-containing protein [Delftia tsuruhatensis]MCX7506059.1 FecR domain-containing protein [Delftia tsuruhatensis]
MPGGNGVMETPLQARVLDEAAEWLMRLHDSGATDADRAACERWRQADPQHALAWERAERLLGKLGGLPAALAMPALDRPRSHRAQRRAAVARLAALLAVAPAGWLAWQAWYAADQRGWGADLRTATGERRTEHLADGSRLLLDTASAVDIRFDGALRLLTLRQGAISIETAADTATPHRPFVVDTAHGRLRALGTRFTVRQEGGRADGGPVRLAVTEGAVEVTLRGAASPALVVQAGQQTVLRAGEVTSPQPLQPEATAWTHGMLMADAMPLAAFCAELSRYRPGLLQCAPEVRALRVSGSFPLGDTDRTLTMLASTYPVDVQTRMRGYWITVVARN